jgi:hypothetical protein
VNCFFPVIFPYTNPPPLFSLATGARRQHRGPRSGGKKTLDKQSYQRREKLFHATIANNDAVLHALPTEASIDHRTEEEVDAVLPWVRFGFSTLGPPSNSDTLFTGCEDCGQLSISRYRCCPFCPMHDYKTGECVYCFQSANVDPISPSHHQRWSCRMSTPSLTQYC